MQIDKNSKQSMIDKIILNYRSILYNLILYLRQISQFYDVLQRIIFNKLFIIENYLKK